MSLGISKLRHFSPSLICASAVLLFSSTLFAVEAPVMVTKVDGKKIAGTITSWSPSGLTLKIENSSDGELEISKEQLLNVSWENSSPIEKQSQPCLLLVDDCRLPIKDFTVLNRKANVLTPLAAKAFSIPTEQIRLVQFSLESEATSEIMRALSDARSVGDVLVIKKKSSALDYLTGVVGNVSEEKIEFEWDGEQIPVKRGKVAALAYYHSRKPQQKEILCKLVTRSGAQLSVSDIVFSSGIVQLSTPTGLEIKVPSQDLAQADYSSGKIAYLSDLKPLRRKWTPQIDLPSSAEIILKHGLPREDQSFSGSTLSLSWQATEDHPAKIETYSKGLALRSRSNLLYRVPTGMRRFICLAGIDPETSGEGSVYLTFYADKRIVWEGEIAGDSSPVEINVELGAAKKFRVFVDYGANLDYGDRLHLVEARLSK